ncbi:MAG: hypothetical protein LBR33_06625 [Propionibacteriaceae bacterium]|jgi:hypothetical protein|nr:hypothetical protein [Propionibacteriaceae bacterium]
MNTDPTRPLWGKIDKNLDERQLLVAGRAYQRALILAFILILANGFLLEAGIEWAPPLYRALIMAMLLTAMGSVELIWRDAYVSPRMRQRQVTALTAMFLSMGAGGVILGLTAVAVGDPLVDGGGLTRDGTAIILGVLFLAIGVTLLLKRRRDRRSSEDSDAA